MSEPTQVRMFATIDVQVHDEMKIREQYLAKDEEGLPHVEEVPLSQMIATLLFQAGIGVSQLTDGQFGFTFLGNYIPWPLTDDGQPADLTFIGAGPAAGTA